MVKKMATNFATDQIEVRMKVVIMAYYLFIGLWEIDCLFVCYYWGDCL